ncbi:MAG: hypothetical protein NXH78_14695 [Hyphomonadaceae bacterium]|nr:hypothetical protein [Hyphomonadaceae bacterium]
MKHLTRNCVALTFLGASAALGAHAADAAGGWTLSESNGSSLIYAATDAGPSVALSCSDQVGIRAVVLLNGESLEEALNAPGARAKSRRVSLETETTDPRAGDWHYIRRQGKLVSTKSWQGKRIYNAAVTGSPVSMDIFKVGERSFELPGVDDQFTTFASSCDATS